MKQCSGPGGKGSSCEHKASLIAKNSDEQLLLYDFGPNKDE